MADLTQAQIDALNKWARTQPQLSRDFPYTRASINSGNLGLPLGDALAACEAAGGFYGLNVKHSDDSASFKGINTLSFEVGNFYLTQNSPNTDEVQVNLRGSSGGSSGIDTLAGDSGTATGATVTLEGAGGIVTSAAGSAVTIDATGISGSFYGIVVKDDVTTVVTDSIEFDGDDFDVAAAGDGATVTLDATVAKLSDIGPGFYGVIFKETEVGGAVVKDDTFKFDSSYFYLSGSPDGKPIVSLHAAPSDPLGGESNTASNIGAGEGVFATKAGVDLEFKSLVEGENISLSSDSDEITINSTSGPGFYGITVKDDSTVVSTDSILFPSADFDVDAFEDGARVQLDSTVARLSDIEPGFYGIVVKDDSTTVVTDSIEFGGDDFNVSASGDGALVELDATVAKLTDIPPGFYGVIVGETGPSNTQPPDDTIRFTAADFVVSNGGDSKPVVSLESDVARIADLPPAFYGIVVKDDSTAVVTDSILFPSADFDVDASGDGARVQLDSTVARLSDIEPGFYGIVVKDDSTTVVTDSIEFSGSDFDVSASGDGALVELDANVAKLSDIPPGFYGVIVGETGPANTQAPDDTIRFTAADFVVSNGGDSKPVVSLESDVARTADLPPAFYGIVVKDDSTVVVTDSILFPSADFDVDASGDGARVQLDSTVARLSDVGPGFYGITVKDDSTTVTTDSIAFAGADFDVSAFGDGALVELDATVAKLSDIGPGFYGVIFKETDSPDDAVFRDDTFKFDSTFFYISASANDGKPIVSLNPIFEPPVVVPGARSIRVRNATGSTITAGQVVYFTGGITGKTPEVGLARADAEATMPAIGVSREDIPNNNFGLVLIEGLVEKVRLNDLGGPFSVGDPLWVSTSTAGDVTDSQPLFPNIRQSIAHVVDNNGNNGSLFVTPGTVFNVDDGSLFSTFSIGTSAAASIVLDPSSTSQRTATFQDASGTVAYLDDIGPGFYGIVVKDDSTTVVTDSIEFDGDDFNVAASGDGATVTLDATVAKLSDIPPGFYGVIVGETGPANTQPPDDTIRFTAADFVVSNGGDSKPVVSLESDVARLADLPPAFYGIVVKDDSTVVNTDSILFPSADFDVDAFEDGARVQLDSTVARLSDLPPAFYGIIVSESGPANTQPPDDTIRFTAADFVVSNGGDSKPLVSLESDIARTADIGPGFYGIVVKQSDDEAAFSGIKVLSFITDDFYITQNSPNTDEVMINTRGMVTTGGRPGGQTVAGSPDDSGPLHLYGTKEADPFENTSTNPIIPHSTIKWKEGTKLSSGQQILMHVEGAVGDGLVLDGRSANVNTLLGFNFGGKVELDSAQFVTVGYAFGANNVFSEVGAITTGTHNVFEAVGFFSGPVLEIAHDGASSADVRALVGYDATPRVLRASGSTGTTTINEMIGFGTNVNHDLRAAFSLQQLNAGYTIDSYAHFSGRSDTTGGLINVAAAATVTEEVGIDLININIGDTAISLRSDAVSATMRHAGKVSIGSTDIPEAYLDVRGSVRGAGFYLSPGANGISSDLGSSWLSFDVPGASVENYFIDTAGEAYIIDEVNVVTSTGSATVAFYIHRDGERFPGVSITGLDPISASSTRTTATATAENIVADGDEIMMSVPSNSFATHLRGRMKIHRSG